MGNFGSEGIKSPSSCPSGLSSTLLEWWNTAVDLLLDPSPLVTQHVLAALAEVLTYVDARLGPGPRLTPRGVLLTKLQHGACLQLLEGLAPLLQTLGAVPSHD